MKILTAAALALTVANTASAEGLYLGGSVEYLMPHAGDAQVVTSLLGGVGAAVGAYDLGVEAEYGMRVSGENDYDTQRVRFWLGRDLGAYNIRLSAGLTQYDFGSTSDDGTNMGLGVQRDIGAGALRAEWIRDFVRTDYTHATTTTRLAYVYKF